MEPFSLFVLLTRPHERECSRCAAPGPVRVLGAVKIKVQNCHGQKCICFLLLLRSWKGISMSIVMNKFRRNVVEKAFTQEIQTLMSNQMSNL